MELTSLLSGESSHPVAARLHTQLSEPSLQRPIQNLSQHPMTMSSASPQKPLLREHGYSTPPEVSMTADVGDAKSLSHHASPSSPSPKHVAFELLLDGNSKVRARIPMRVQIFPHDTTDSIVTTVKNFYGIYEGPASGVSFEDENGNTLIARYENLRNNMTVYVRVIPGHGYADPYGQPSYHGLSQMDGLRRPSLGEPFHMPPPQPAQILDYGQPPSRPTSRIARKRSVSPSGRGRRSTSAQKASSRSGNKSRGSSTHGSFHDDTVGGYSDSDGGQGSITGSRKARSEQFASSDISRDNILQDGRRKRPKFESSELPLFVPPQVPLTTSTSSISPQRRTTTHDCMSPFARPIQRPFASHQPLPSPQSFGHHEQLYGFGVTANPIYATPAAPPHGHLLRDRTNAQSIGRLGSMGNRSSGHGILPTPDPTIASCISDEDVAMQLIRLGDASNFSHGRTSASTLDDGFSGAAEASSSTGATTDGAEASEDEYELPPRSRQKLESSPMLPPGVTKKQHKNLDEILPSCDSSDPSSDDFDGDYHHGHHQGLIKDEFDEGAFHAGQVAKAKRAKHKPGNAAAIGGPLVKPGPSSKTNKSIKNRAAGGSRKARGLIPNGNHKFATPLPPPPPPPTSTAIMPNPVASRKIPPSAVNFQHQLAADEEDLSTKPRCQRCRKSKKGCDRQRPCQRCKDAGIGIEGCISEDEGNGRKGRYGRHMGVPVKKSLLSISAAEESQPTGTALILPPAASSVADKSKKRKR